MFADYFWAKKSLSKNGLYYWLPLTQHLVDTDFVMGRLWEDWISDGQRELIESSLKGGDPEAEKLVRFVALTHDGGKLTPAFQLKSYDKKLKDLDEMLYEKIEKIGFKGAKEIPMPSLSDTKHAMASQVLLESYGVREDVASIVGAHHGRPLSSDDKHSLQLTSYGENYNQGGSDLSKLWNQGQKEIFQWALEKSGYESLQDIPHITQPAAVILSGLLIAADWISSNEKYFPLLRIEEEKVADNTERLHKGWIAWEKTDRWKVNNEVDIDEIYEERFGFKNPRTVQKIFTESLDKIDDPGIVIFEAPMGIGKTEAALVAAEQLAYKNKCSGLFFGLPTQATSNGMFPRVNDWLHAALKGKEVKSSIRLKHGKAELNESFNKIAKGVNVDESQDESVIVNEWFSGRKTAVLDDFVVGTVDQFLMLALKQRHLALRHLGFSKKVVILDEVHSYTCYMSQYLYMAVKWMGAYGIPVIVLSATLPAEKRIDLVKNYMEGAGYKWKKLDKAKSLSTNAYPLITYNDSCEIKQEVNFPLKEQSHKNVKIIREDSENIVNLIDGLVSQGGVVGIIVNTVKRAQDLYRQVCEVYGEDMVDLLHSSFIATDRVKKEDQLMEMIGKGAKRPDKKIIIGTQVIEQSLDIDFDVMITEIAPMDLLIQRIGRLFRHDIKRPIKHQEPVCYVTDFSEDLEFESGAGIIYDKYILARTQYFLTDVLKIPEDISPLVQKVYSEEKIEFPEEDKNRKLRKLKREYKRYLETKEEKANTFKLKEPIFEKGFSDSDTLIDWSTGVLTNLSEERAYAQVRDTEESLEVIALQKIGNGYGFFGTNTDLSERALDFETAKEIAKHTIRLPLAITKGYDANKVYRIDKIIKELEEFKMEHLSNWQNSQWLKGSLGILFDENGNAELQSGFKLHYSTKCGLAYTKKERM